ncbi:hypothetical protein CSV60_05940 [Sporosarcina sp. P7]|nr:hypothetical protein CSV77_11510 [Sporosarcina sp. P16b]PID25168.1 hypothetical protein CSV60_05940 [Sporosarcina sp. P7]
MYAMDNQDNIIPDEFELVGGHQVHTQLWNNSGFRESFCNRVILYIRIFSICQFYDINRMRLENLSNNTQKSLTISIIELETFHKDKLLVRSRVDEINNY